MHGVIELDHCISLLKLFICFSFGTRRKSQWNGQFYGNCIIKFNIYTNRWKLFNVNLNHFYCSTEFKLMKSSAHLNFVLLRLLKLLSQFNVSNPLCFILSQVRSVISLRTDSPSHKICANLQELKYRRYTIHTFFFDYDFLLHAHANKPTPYCRVNFVRMHRLYIHDVHKAFSHSQYWLPHTVVHYLFSIIRSEIQFRPLIILKYCRNADKTTFDT